MRFWMLDISQVFYKTMEKQQKNELMVVGSRWCAS